MPEWLHVSSGPSVLGSPPRLLEALVAISGRHYQALHASHPLSLCPKTNSAERRLAMYAKQLELVELREKAMSARARASRARRLAARTPHSAAPFEGVASSLETKAMEAEEQARSIEGHLGSEPRRKA